MSSGKYLDYLKNIRGRIENMSKFNQIEILKILNSNNSTIINENKNGIHINLSEVDPNIIAKINNFISYLETQEEDLKADEIKKKNLETQVLTQQSQKSESTYSNNI